MPIDHFAVCDARIDVVDLLELLEQGAIGSHFNHVDILAKHAIVIRRRVADAPHQPQLIGSATHRFHQIRIANPCSV